VWPRDGCAGWLESGESREQVDKKKSENEGSLQDRSSLSILVCYGSLPEQAERAGFIASHLQQHGYCVALAGNGESKNGRIAHYPLAWPEVFYPEYGTMWADSAKRNQAQLLACVEAECALMAQIQPAAIISDGCPTVFTSTLLCGVDLLQVIPPGLGSWVRSGKGFLVERASPEQLIDVCARHLQTTIKTRKHTLLVADIPVLYNNFAPLNAPYYFVGPLGIPASAPVATTDCPSLPEGNGPLIYMAVPEHEPLEDLLREYKDKLERFSCRWIFGCSQGLSLLGLPQNVALVSQHNLSQVLSQLDLYIGEVDIPLIYRLLRQAVPVIGYSRYTDEIALMDKVSELRLGLSLELADGTLAQVFERLDGFVTCQAALKISCEEFALTVHDMWDQHLLVESVDHYFATRDTLPDIAQNQRTLTIDELIKKLSERPWMKGVDIPARVQQYIEQGIPHSSVDQLHLFDGLSVLNWVNDYDCDYFSGWHREAYERHRSFFVLKDRLHCRNPQVRYRISYTYEFDLGAVDPGQQLHLFLPYPVPTKFQRDIRLVDWYPTDLAECHMPECGFFYGYEVARGHRGQEPQHIHYAFEVTIQERTFEKTVALPVLAEREHYLQVPPGLCCCEDVVQFRQQALGWEKRMSDEEKARRLYEAIFRTKKWRSYVVPNLDLASCLHSMIGTDGGSCIVLIRAFIALCRMEGIPARELRGCTLGYPCPDSPGIVTYGGEEPVPFRHLLGEIFLEEYGWVPIESESTVITAVGMTDGNTRDPELRHLIETWTEPALAYFFGNLDHNHLVGPEEIDRFPLCMAEYRTKTATGTYRNLQPVEVPFHCEQRCVLL
jgi:hypothetical protein